MLQIKIHGATPKGGKSICHSCKKATVIKGQNCQEVILCGLFDGGGRVPFKVAECGGYHPVNMPWLHEMEDMAWKIEARRRGPVGFNDPTARESEMEVVVVRPRNSNVPNTPE
jgi:hypothetical protein